MSGILAATVGGGIGELVINITSTVNPNIPALVTAAGWLGTMQKIRIVSTGQVNTLDIPAGTLSGADITLDLSAASFIGGTYNSGTALKTRIPIKVRNLGTLAGGGGAGGRGGNAWVQRMFAGSSQSAYGYGGTAGDGQGFEPGSMTVRAAGARSNGSEGTLAPTGSFGGVSRGAASAVGGGGGAGGSWGAAGQSDYATAGVSGDYDTYGAYANAAGQLAGKAVDGNSYITWISTGTRLGGIT